MRAKPFAYTREQLNGICVDPKSVPLARAVFSSAATPVYFAPLVMRSFAGGCGYRPPDTIALDPDSIEDVYRRERAERLLSFLDPNYPYLHLADGALADNLGARAILDEVAMGENICEGSSMTPASARLAAIHDRTWVYLCASAMNLGMIATNRCIPG